MSVQIGTQHRGGEVLAHSVLHDLDAAGDEPSGVAGAFSALDEPVELADPQPTLPPERTDHPCGKQPAAVCLKVGVEAVGDDRIVADDRLLPAGDAKRVQVTLGLSDAGDLLGDL